MEGLSIICAGLGTVEEDDDGNRIGYSRGDYCLDNLKDLLRFLRRDDPQTREVFNQVCRWNIVGKDLIPVIEFCQDDRNLVLNAVKVLVFLTMPIERQSNDIPQQIENLWGIKSAITCSVCVPVITALLETPLENLENESFTEDDWKLVQLVLTLFRNILAIQDIPVQQKAGGSATHFLSLRDKFLEQLFHENVMEVILVLTQHVGGSTSYLRQDNLLLLETFHYIFMGQNPEVIAKADFKNLEVDENTETTINSLKCIMEEEKQKRVLNRLRSLGCNSQFSGSFTRVTLDGSTTVFKGNPCSASHEALFKSQKHHRGQSKRMVWDQGLLPTTKKKVIDSLHDFLNHFLSGGYNVLMESIREDIEREHHAIQNSDVVIFFQVACFVTTFQYHKVSNLQPSIEADAEASTDHNYDTKVFQGSVCGPVAESLNESMFLLLISKWRYAFDALKETNDYTLLSAAGSLLKIMIRMLDLVLKQSGKDSREPKIARVLLYKLFYDQTEGGMTQFLFSMMKSFDKHKQARSYLANLVESIHLIIRLMENLQEGGTLRVFKKSKKKHMKKKSNDRKNHEDEVAANISAAHKEGDKSVHEEPIEISMLETEKETNHDSHEKKDMHTRTMVEMDILQREGPIMEKMCGNTNDNLGLGVNNSSDDEPAVKEVDLQTSTLVSSLANNTIIKNLCWLLKFYKSNSWSTNHYIISMLRRICDDLDLSPMLYQLSLLSTFFDILDEQRTRPCQEYRNIVLFLSTLVRRMLRKMKKYPLLFVEVLFCKTRNECRYINCESLLHELSGLKQGRGRSSTGGQGWARRSIADALGDDEADFVISHGDGQMNDDLNKVNQDSSGEDLTSLSDEGIEGDPKLDKEQSSIQLESKRVRKKRKSLDLNDELEDKIKDLYEKYKDDENCYHLIAEALNQNGNVSPVQISRTLKLLGYDVPAKRNTSTSSTDNQSLDKHPSLNTLEEKVSLRKPLLTRKKVRAFSEDQEQKIRDLFEQFKNHKRCNYMIANALDAEGTFSTAQISRKLKQLGLRVPQKKKLGTNLHWRDEPLGDISVRSPGNSDDEPLLSLQKRTKFQHSDAKVEQDLQESLQGDSDEELISSMLVQSSVKVNNQKGENNTREENLRNEDVQESGRDDCSHLAETGNAATRAATSLLNSSRQHSEVAVSSEPEPFQYETLEDELTNESADLGHDAEPVVLRNSSASRRQLRMVIDGDDDE